MKTIQPSRFAVMAKSGASAALLILAVALVFGVYARSLGVQIGFFRAESGLYLNMAFAPWQEQWSFVRSLILSSYNGHFAPVVFLGELLQSRVFGADEWLWFLRQMLVVGILGAACMAFVYQVARTVMPARTAMLAGSGGGSFFLFQPVMIDLINWPFMAFQMLCLALMAMSAYFLARYLSAQRRGDFAAFLLIGYSTMQVFGVGAAMSASALLTGAIALLVLLRTKELSSADIRHGIVVLLIATGLTLLHGLLMVRGIPDQNAGVTLPLSVNAIRFFALLMESILSGAQSLWANGGFAWPRTDVRDMQAVYGLGVFVIAAVIMAGLIAKYCETKQRVFLAGFALLCYPFMALVINTALITYRLRTEVDDGAMLNYLIGSRYVIFPAFFVFMISSMAGIFLFRAFAKLSAILPIIFAAIAAWATAIFIVSVAPMIWPQNLLSHEAEWRVAVQHSKEQIDAGGPIQNMDLSKLGQGFNIDLRAMRYLLAHELGCTDCVKFAP
jgi:hypothetical protein